MKFRYRRRAINGGQVEEYRSLGFACVNENGQWFVLPRLHRENLTANADK